MINMARKMKPVLNPTSTLVVPIAGASLTQDVTVNQMLVAAGIMVGTTLDANVEAYRIVGVTARADSNATVQSFVKFAGGQTYQLSDPYNYAKLSVSDRNPLGFWKSAADDSKALEVSAADIGSITIAVRFKNVSFQ